LQHGVDHLEGLIDLLSDLGTSEDNLAADEDEEHDLGLDHAVDETGEQFRLVGAEVVMLGRQTLETNGELDVTRPNDVLNLEVGELGIEAELLDDARVLARGKLRVIFRLCTRDNHLAARKDQRRGLGLANTHDDSGETLGIVLLRSDQVLSSCTKCGATYLGIPRMERNRLEIKTAIKIDRRDDVPDLVSAL
jgi:hypothetical protein